MAFCEPQTTSFPTLTHPSQPWVIYPLTTVFTPPVGCPSIIQMEHLTKSLACAPEYLSEAWDWWQGFYSPAICPSGYTVGCDVWNGPKMSFHSFTDVASVYGDSWPILTDSPDETAKLCVPSGYRCHRSVVWYASSTYGVFSTLTTSVPAIQIRWRSSDLDYLETHPMYPGSSPWTSLCTTPPSISSDDIPGKTGEPNPGSSSSLSVGGIVGIVVGVLLVASLIAGAIIMLCIRRRRENHHHEAQTTVAGGGQPRAPGGGPVFLGGTGNVSGGQPVFVPAEKTSYQVNTAPWSQPGYGGDHHQAHTAPGFACAAILTKR